MRRISGYILVLVGCIALDQWTKQLAITHLKGQFPVVYFSGIFRFDYTENPGAFLGAGGTLSPEMRFWLLTVMVAVFLVGCLYYLFTHPELKALTAYSLAAVLGGGISNLIDRLFRTEGRVVDFMNVGIGEIRTGIFNIADMAILFGVIILMVQMFFEKETSPSETTSSPAKE